MTCALLQILYYYVVFVELLCWTVESKKYTRRHSSFTEDRCQFHKQTKKTEVMAENNDVNNDIAQSPTADVNAVTQRLSAFSIEYQQELTEKVITPVISENLYTTLQTICKHLFATFEDYNGESVYQNALILELKNLGIGVETEVSIPITYGSNKVEVGTRRADLILTLDPNSKVILELKAVKSLKEEHYNQLLYYMEHFRVEHGFLINFPTKASFPVIDKNRYYIEQGREALEKASTPPKTQKKPSVQILEVKRRSENQATTST